MQWLKRIWRGEEKLRKVFYVYGPIGLLSSLALSVSILALCVFFNRLAPEHTEERIWTYATFPLWPLGIYTMFMAIALTKNAHNSTKTFWRYGARILAVLLFFVLGRVGYFALHDETLKAGFLSGYECRNTMKIAAEEEGIKTDDYIKKHHAEMAKCLCERRAESFARARDISSSDYIKLHQTEYDRCLEKAF